MADRNEDYIVLPTPKDAGEPKESWFGAWLAGRRRVKESRGTEEFTVIRVGTPGGARRYAPEFYPKEGADKFASIHYDAMIEAGYDREDAMREYVVARFVPPKFMQLPFLWRRYYKSPKK